MKRILTIIFLACAVSVGAQEQQEIPAYRHKGYAGSVSFTDQCIIIIGLDTSHGYMFDEQNYLGAGLGFYYAPGGIGHDCPPGSGRETFFMAVHVFAEYKLYWFKKRSTPTAGAKVGYGISPEYPDDSQFELEPYIGWDWGLKKGRGFSVALGANMFLSKGEVFPVLKLSLGISF